jgi:hypothetical protein
MRACGGAEPDTTACTTGFFDVTSRVINSPKEGK